MTHFSSDIIKKAKEIKMVALDVDGVLTDGGIILDDHGTQSKRFYVRDGLGIRLMLQSGLKVGLLTARQSNLVTIRSQELSLSFVHQGVHDKWACLQEELQKTGLTPQQCAFMGDDWVDLPVLNRVGLSSAPLDADTEVRNRVDWISTKKGGHGAVRELAEKLLHAQNKWTSLLASFEH